MRAILGLLTCCSLLIALALTALCARSFWRNDSLFVERGPRGYFVASARGRVGVIRVSGSWHPRRHHWATYDLATDNAVLTTIARSKDTRDLIVMLSGDGKLPGVFGQSRWFAIPYATLIAPCAVMPGVVLTRAWRRRRRARRGLCRQCGYDLRASPQRCPECGSVPEQREAARGAGPSSGRSEVHRPDDRPARQRSDGTGVAAP
jgi:hypothetical protein